MGINENSDNLIITMSRGNDTHDKERSLASKTSSVASFRNLRKGSDDRIVRTPSLVSFHELDEEKSLELLQRKSKSILSKNADQVLNSAVRNRTGKPATKPGLLADSASTVSGRSEASNFAPNYVNTTTRRESTRPDAPQYGVSQSRTQVRTSQDNTRSSTRIPEPSRAKSSLRTFESSKASTPSTFARQREIEKKSRKEKEEVKAKYQNAAHHSVLGGGSHEQLSLGGQNKTSFAALSHEGEAKKESITQQSSRTPTMKLSTGNNGVKAPRTKRRTRRVVNAQSNLESLLADADGNPDKQQETLNAFDELPQELFDLIELSDDEEEYNFSDLSSLSSETDEAPKQSNKTSFFPFLDGLTILNFTKNFNFSYFIMPSYIKEKNQKVRKGPLKLPVISASKNRMERRRRSSGGKSTLMKRIEKLNRVEGTTDPRVRH